MLTVNYITKFLSSKQDKINDLYYNKIKDFELNKQFSYKEEKEDKKYKEDKNINEFNKIINNKIDFDVNIYFNDKIYKNKSPIFTFLNSIFYITNNSFDLYDIQDKEKIIKEFILKIDKELFEDNLYNKFGYNINKKFNKGDIQSILKNAFQFKMTDSFHLFKKYISDYLGINIYILKLINKNIDIVNSEYYVSNRFYNKTHKFLPNYIILEDNNIYKPILLNIEDDNNSILLYSKNIEIIDNIWNNFNIKDEHKDEHKDERKDEPIEINKKINEDLLIEEEMTEINLNISEESSILSEDISMKTDKSLDKKYKIDDLKKYKIDDLKKLCIENNIDLKKISEKTNKQINKLKDDLITDLLKL
jgi:hypothetical protein